MTLNIENIPMLTVDDNRVCAGKLDWSGLTADDISSYTTKTDILLDTIDLPKDALLCCDVNCKSKTHSKDLCSMYDLITLWLKMLIPLRTYKSVQMKFTMPF